MHKNLNVHKITATLFSNLSPLHSMIAKNFLHFSAGLYFLTPNISEDGYKRSSIHIYGHLRFDLCSDFRREILTTSRVWGVTFVSISRRHLLPGLLGRQSTGQFRTNLKSFKFSLKMPVAALKMANVWRENGTKWKLLRCRS